MEEFFHAWINKEEFFRTNNTTPQQVKVTYKKQQTQDN